MLTIAAWLAALAAGGIAVMTAVQAAACARRHDGPGGRAALTAALAAACVTACVVTVLGIIPAFTGLALSGVTAFGALGVIWRDGREPWDVLVAAGRAVRDIWRPAPAAPGDLPDDELAPRREARAEPLRAAVPDLPPMPAPPPPPSPARERPPMTTPPPPDGAPAGAMPGSVADIFNGVQQIIMRANAEGMPGKHRAVKMFADMHEYLSRAENEFARRMSEPDQGYPPQVWEPLAKAASHSRASSLAFGESDQALSALARMPVGDLASSPVRSPHHNEFNAFT